MPDCLTDHASHQAVGSTLHQLEGKAAPDAVSHEEKFPDAEMVHQPELIVGEGAPWIVDGDRTGGFAAIRVALIHRDAAEIVLEGLHGVEDRGGPIADP